MNTKQKETLTKVIAFFENNVNELLLHYLGFGGIDHCTKEDTIKETSKHVCNTSCCYLGYFPYIPGLEPVESDFNKHKHLCLVFSYVNYQRRILNFSIDYWYFWDFLFAEEWDGYDMLLSGAVARTKFMLKNPTKIKGFDFEDFRKDWHLGTEYETILIGKNVLQEGC